MAVVDVVKGRCELAEAVCACVRVVDSAALISQPRVCAPVPSPNVHLAAWMLLQS